MKVNLKHPHLPMREISLEQVKVVSGGRWVVNMFHDAKNIAECIASAAISVGTAVLIGVAIKNR